MTKHLDVAQCLTIIDRTDMALKSYMDHFDFMEAAILRVIELEDFLKGKGGVALLRNYQELQLPAIRAIRAFMFNMKDKGEKLRSFILSFESSDNGMVSEDFYENQIPRGYDRFEQFMDQNKSEIDSIAASVNYIIDLGRLNIRYVQDRVDNARKHANDTSEGLNELDHEGMRLMRELQREMAELKAILKQVTEWTVSGGALLNGVYLNEIRNHFSDKTLHTKAPEVDTSKVNTSLYNPTLADNPALVKNFMFMQQHSIIDMYSTAFPLTFQSTYLQVYSQQTKEAHSNNLSTGAIGEGKITYKWDGPGDKIQARGVPIDYKALGIEDYVETVKVNGYDVHYALIDGQFILLRDNPDLEYYTQGAKTGKLEAEIAGMASFTSYAVGAYSTSSVANKIPGIKGIADKHPIKSQYGGAFALQRVQNSIPIWKEIVGTPVPKAGTEQVLVYISDDGENWDGKVMFTIEPNGDVKRSTDFSDGFVDAVRKLFGSDKK
ncbi:ribonuclease YeeF family protein [Bacillus sp. JCM 19034]|uniref:ribonuclease YeeF family protein n=1 Tax=Bacillus sp. JCM 19034 TaxID=1481928 RepID=UPI000780D470|nr:T7SS effector LXG polymorphic toxin [Bacillus sp. JCM 19034]